MCRRHAASGLRSTLAVSVLVVLAACGDKVPAKPSTQVAAKVGKGEISVHQLNLVLKRQGQLPPEQQEAAKREVLERLIDQELSVQKAESLKLDRDPQVMQLVEAAKRDIIARTYMDRVASSAAAPSRDEVKQYHDSHPLLFAQRRIYDLQEVAAKATAEQAAAVTPKLNAARSAEEAATLLRAAGLAPDVRQSSLAPENMPLPLLDRVATLQGGQPLLINAAGGVRVVFVAGARAAAVDEATAAPRIEAFLLNERKRQAIEQDLKAMRAANPVEYTGPFAGAASAPAQPQPQAPAAAPSKPAASTGLDDATINRGLK
jgi:EpsD family peptidyl-prolyl cis-trans isomerase